MKIKVDVDTKTFVRFLLVVTGFAAFIYALTKLGTPLTIIGISCFLALALNPPVSALARRLPGHSRVLATALSYLFVLTVIGTFIYIAVPPIIDQTNRFIATLPHYVHELSEQRGVVADLVNRYNLQDQINNMVAGAQQQASSLAQGLGGSIIGGIASVLSGVLTLVTVLVLTFLMLIEGPAWLNRLWSLYDDKRKLARHQKLAVQMYNVVTGYVNGQVLVATIAASAALTMLLIITNVFHLSSTVVIPLTGIIFLFELVPIIGASIAALIVALVLALNDVGAAGVFLIYIFIYVQIESNFIAPLVQSRKVALTALSVFVAIVMGISSFGIIGGIVAIPIAGCIRVLVIDYVEHRHKLKVAPLKRGFWQKLAGGKATQAAD
jgi:predicted PurR-regulated permease PerM